MRHRTARIVSIAMCFSTIVAYGYTGERHGRYYELLSKAFLGGQVSLLDDSRYGTATLAKLPDPYEPSANGNTRAHLHDASFYQGRFYLAWGPTPALILAGLHTFYRPSVADGVLVVVFLSGMLLFSTLLLLWVRSRFYPELPSRYLILGVALAGLTHPILWLLGRAAVYEAAIAGGQCFLIAGIYWGLSSMGNTRPSAGRLALSGVSLALALGARVSLAPATLFVAASLTWWMWAHAKSLGSVRLHLASIALNGPLIGGAFIFGIYNYLRFGSLFELGMRYQLAGVNIHRLFENGQATSMAYVPFNVYQYLALPYRVTRVKPYVVPLHELSQKIRDLRIPNFVAEHVTGIFWSTPVVWFSLVPLAMLLWQVRRNASHSQIEPTDGQAVVNGSLRRTVDLVLAGAVICALAPLLTFVGASMRYVADFSPALILLSVFGMWDGLRNTHAGSAMRRLVVIAVVVLSIVSITLGVHWGFHSAALQSSVYR